MTLADVLVYLALWVAAGVLIGSLWLAARCAVRRRRRP